MFTNTRLTARERRLAKRHNREAERVLDYYGYSVAYLHATDCATYRSLMRGESLSRRGYWSHITRAIRVFMGSLSRVKRGKLLKRYAST